MKKTNKNKNTIDQQQQIASNDNKKPITTNMYEIEIDENDLNINNITNNALTINNNTLNKNKFNINTINTINNQKTPK